MKLRGFSLMALLLAEVAIDVEAEIRPKFRTA